MQPLTRERLVRLVGELDELAFGRIQTAGVSEAEVVEALGWLHRSEQLRGRRPSSPGVSRAYTILKDAWDRADQDDDDWG